MSVGFQPSAKQDVNSRAGDLATRWRQLVNETRSFAGDWLAGQSTADLVALGFTQSPTDEPGLLVAAFVGGLLAGCDQLEGKATPAAHPDGSYLFWSDKIKQP